MLMSAQFEPLIEAISSAGFACTEDLFSESELLALHNELKTLIEEGEIRSARIGQLNVEREVSEIRSDEIFWLHPEEPRSSTEGFFKVMSELSSYITATCFISLNRMEFHFARYAPGAFYKRHKDSFRGGNSRKFSVILYLNPEWKSGDGGELILFLNHQEISIEPTWGKLVIFPSDQIEHEVSVTHKTRYSLTGWLRYDDLTLSLDLSS